MASPDPTVSEPEIYDDILTEESSISDEDRREILADIEDVVRKNRITVSEDLFRIRPQKSGVLLPTLINILAIAAVGAVFFYSARFFEARQETMSLQVSTVTGAEGRLLEELKRESAEQIARKEEEISRIQDELARIESQARTLQTDFESALQQREEELRAELELELEAERVRLQALDITPAEMDSRLREFEIQKQQELQQRIEEFRIQMRAEMAEREEELQQARAAANQILDEANAEREAILQEAVERETRLAERYEAERQALVEASSAAQLRLEEIARRQETENLLTDQILASYSSIMESMRNREFQKALEQIGTLQNLLEDPRIDDLPRIARRREVERFVLSTLQEDIRSEMNAETADTGGLVNAAQRLFNARELISRGEAALEAGREEEARNLFQEAVAALPSVRSAVSRIADLDARERRSQALQLLEQGNRLIGGGDTAGAIQAYRDAASAIAEENDDTLQETLDRLQEAVTQGTSAALAAENEARVEELRREYEDRIVELTEISLASEEETSGRLAQALNRVEELEGLLEQGNRRIRDLETSLQQERDLIAEGREILEKERREAAEFQATIASLEQEIRELENTPRGVDPEAAASLQAGYQAELQQRETRISELTDRLNSTQASLARTEERLTRSQEQRQQLEEDLNAAVIELVDVVTQRQGDERYTALARNYVNYQSRLESLISGGSSSDFRKAEELLNSFYREQAIRQVFPNLEEYSSRIMEGRIEAAEEQAKEEVFSAARKYAGEDELVLRAIEKIRDLAQKE
ncbi:hypothetical protein [Marispirochaeta aestuarii]|uniref:hypothetical protein n=1 Tax=Marispirochaeta aestuarii TaxID=1963862 RepID=UPI0029C7DA9F|nr:hypothetical protein [Marispirochaeta aestuarii]